MSASVTADPHLPEAVMHLVMPNDPVTATVVSNERCTRGKSAGFVRHISIDVGGTPLEGKFLAGQSFGVVPAGTDSNGKPHKVRLYSIASPSYGEDGNGRVLSTTCKRLIDERTPDASGRGGLFLGVCSNYLCDLAPGDTAMVSGPAGKRFLLPVDRDAHDYLFLATGTGIAPFRGMIHELLVGPPEGSAARQSWNGPCRSRIHLVMGTPYTTDLLYDGWLSELQSRHPNFTYHPVISREALPKPGWGPHAHHYVAGRIDEFAPMLRSDRTLMYLCGLAGMQVGLFRSIAAAGLAGGFLNIQDEISGIDPSTWTDEQVKRRIRPTHRCMMEVY
jgi:ferredoxin--NADP+ reductase